jgi:hypothetical protein
MTATTTEIVATNCVILLDNAANVLTDISGSLNSVKFSPKNGIAEWRVFGDQWKSRKVVGKDMPVSIHAIFTTAAAEAAQLTQGWFFGGNDSPRSLMIDVPDSQVGAFRLYGEFVLDSYDVSLDTGADDVVYVDIELLPDGEVQFATVAT